MTYAPPDENTLGAVLREKPRGSDATRRVIQAQTPRQGGLGTSFLGVGAAIIVGVRMIYGLVQFSQLWATYPNPLPALLAWVVLVGAVLTVFVRSRMISEQLPDWIFAIFLVGLAASLVLDLLAIWPLHDIGRNASAAVASGLAVIVLIALRRPAEIIVTVAVIGLVLTTAIALNTPLDASTFAPQVQAIAFAVLPAVIGLVIVGGFRRLVQGELDRVLVQSTVSAPRFAVGMMASEELARLDLAAEELLDSVATGKMRLPLAPKTASVAASLATELRLHLIEGRRETWLYHAITESDLLGKSVSLIDKASLAGLLDPAQRDGLLSAAWLLVSDTAKGSTGRTVQIAVGPATDSVETAQGRKIVVPISITTTGVARNRVDPATWAALGKVGQYSDSTRDASLRVDIGCLVDNPADQ